MKSIKSYVSLVAVFFCLIFIVTGCKKEDEDEVKDLYVLDIGQESRFDYWLICKTGDYIMVNEDNSRPSEIFVRASGSSSGYTIFLNSYGLPSKAVIGSYIFVFDNFNGTKVDVSVVKPNGEIFIARNLESGFDWASIKSVKRQSDDWSDVIRISGHVVGGIGCIIGLATAIPSAGITLPLTIIGCGATAIGILTEFIPDDGEILGLSATTVGTFATIVGCINIANVADELQCATGLYEIGAEVVSSALDDIEERQDDVYIAESVLYAGHGAIQITLTWNNTSDTDLHVVDPNNEEVWWYNPYSSSGGILDYDDRDGYGPENIYWGSNAPAGTYEVYVHHYDGEAPVKYTVLVVNNDKVKKYTGTLNYDEWEHIVDFSHSSMIFNEGSRHKFFKQIGKDKEQVITY